MAAPPAMSSMRITTQDGRTLTARIDTRQVFALDVPREDWEHTDAAGHTHTYSRAAQGWPTLVWKIDRDYWCESCSDEHSQGHWECGTCGDPVTPATGPGMQIITAGPPTYEIDGRPVSEAEGKAFALAAYEEHDAVKRAAGAAAVAAQFGMGAAEAQRDRL